MRIVLTLLIRDEADVVAANLDYHAAEGVDHIIVTDNGSRDGTREILAEYERSGAITLIDEPPADFSQHRWVTRMARLAHERHAADWVINADADELFLWDGGSLREAFARVPASLDSFLARRHDFVPFERPCRQPPQIEMVYRKLLSRSIRGQILPPKVVHRGAPDVVIKQGNHGAISERFRQAPQHWEVEVMHYPIRSLQQFESKVRNGGSGYAINQELPKRAGFHKKWWYERLLAGELGREFHEQRFFNQRRLEDNLRSGEVIVDRRAADRVATLPRFSAGMAPTAR